ncbi:Catalase domain protein [Burkholderiales bacterium]|nr:Catalase domain protein [Burkholderiales bacterium]
MTPSPLRSPSRDWHERIDPDEGPRFARYAQLFAQMQRAQSARFGPGRALHRRQLLAVHAQFEVLEGLPEHARHGLFARPGCYDAWVRLSNGASSSNPDRRADVRGFAIKVLGVRGPGALGAGETECQDFLLIQLPATGFASSADFVEVALAAAKGPLAVIRTLVRRHGLIGGLRRLQRIGAGLKAPFSGFATERFYSALPLACGPYAVRARLRPPTAETAGAGAQDGWAQDLAERLRQRPLVYEFQLQFFVDEARTPIEDGSVDWPEAVAPYLTVARLTLPKQIPEAAFGQRVEAATFDPWAALAEHRPLGELMRARKVVYYTSQQGRGQST